MTTYALDTESGSLLAVWGTGVGHRAVPLCRLGDSVGQPVAEELCEGLTRLSEALWETYVSPAGADSDPDIEELTRRERGEGFAGVVDAIREPHLPDGSGLLLVSYDPVLEYAHTVGRALHTIDDVEVATAVAAEVGVEVDAVVRAELGDLSGRAAQAVSLDRVDVSPVQVEAADRILFADPLGSVALWTSVDAAAACVATAHWLAAAAQVAGEAAGRRPAGVFSYADDMEAVSVEVPTHVVTMVVDEEVSARAVVTALLGDAAAVRAGRVPDPAGLLERVDDARAQVRQVPVTQRDSILAALLERLTPLDPLRPARDLLEHLLSGMRACLLVYQEEASTEDSVAGEVGGLGLGEEDDFDEDAADEASARASEAFIAAVREQAAGRRGRLTR